MIYEDEPDNFIPSCEVVSCFVEHEGEILMLHRQDHKPQGNTWAGPAGKVDAGEEISQALKREVFEETGIKLINPKHFKKLFVRFPEYDFIYHIFHEEFLTRPEVIIREEEHKAFRWVKPIEVFEDNDLMMDEGECIKMFYKINF